MFTDTGELESSKKEIIHAYRYKTVCLMADFLLKNNRALAGVAQWIERRSSNQRVTGSISSLGHMPGLQARSPVGGAQDATTH